MRGSDRSSGWLEHFDSGFLGVSVRPKPDKQASNSLTGLTLLVEKNADVHEIIQNRRIFSSGETSLFSSKERQIVNTLTNDDANGM